MRVLWLSQEQARGPQRLRRPLLSLLLSWCIPHLESLGHRPTPPGLDHLLTSLLCSCIKLSSYNMLSNILFLLNCWPQNTSCSKTLELVWQWAKKLVSTKNLQDSQFSWYLRLEFLAPKTASLVHCHELILVFQWSKEKLPRAVACLTPGGQKRLT